MTDEELRATESLALMIAKRQCQEGRTTGPNIVAMLCMTIERLAGIADWAEDDD